MARFSRKQILTLVVFSVCQVFNAVCVSLQAPFYPAEAEKKGAVPSQYGFVFGIYELVVFIMSPIYGKYIDKIGVKVVNNTGIFIMAITCFLFGLLDKMQGVANFIGFSFAIRIVEATGSAAFNTASFSIIAREFPNSVGMAFAFLETFFGLGLIIGPTLGGCLYQLGGFMLPFTVVSVLLLTAGLLVLCFLPNEEEDLIEEGANRGDMITALKFPEIQLALFTVAGASISIGFLQATLEPHMRPLHLTPALMGLMFVLNGGMYALSAPFWGKLCDGFVGERIVCAIGAVLIAISFFIIGPAPFLPIKTSITLCMIALVIHGVGFGAELVATFSVLHKDSLKRGFSDNLNTYALVSGLWASSFALGCFVGPSAAGLLFDSIGFPWAAMMVVGYHVVIFMLTCLYLCYNIKQRPIQQVEERQPILETKDIESSQTVPINVTLRPSFTIPSYSSFGSLLNTPKVYYY